MNKTVLITGAAKRIGKEIAYTFFNDGWNVIIHFNKSEKDAKNLTEELNKLRSNSTSSIQADLNSLDDVMLLAEKSLDVFGQINGLINNASTFYATPMGKISDDDWNALIGSNLKAPLFLIQALHKELKENKGFIVNITDINDQQTIPDHSIYLAAKSGLHTLTKVLAKELAPEIRVNGVAPGAILEPPNTKLDENKKNKILKSIPLGRMGTESDIAKAVLFLADSLYITGEILNIDGGKFL